VPSRTTAESHPALVRGLIYCVIALALIEVVAHLVVAIRAPKDAKAPKDERERVIELKAIRIAHYVFVVGVLLAVSSMIHIGANVFAMAYHVLMAFVVAELANYGARIVYHRRGV
jgi:archaellum biogenesis protein FlaJ (TadC family)